MAKMLSSCGLFDFVTTPSVWNEDFSVKGREFEFDFQFRIISFFQAKLFQLLWSRDQDRVDTNNSQQKVKLWNVKFEK